MADGTPARQFVGVDLHLHRSVVCRIDELGQQLEVVQIDNDPVALCKAVRRAGRRAPVAIEATYGWYWAVDALQAAHFEVHLAHPYGMRALRKRKRVKTDARDAYELANLLRLGSLPEAFIAPAGLRELRELVRYRMMLVRSSTSVRAGIRALLAKHGIRLAVRDLHSERGQRLLEQISLMPAYMHRLDGLARLMLMLEGEIAATEAELDRRLKWDRRYRALLTIRGIGPVLAAVFVAEIGDVSRFPNAHALACWAGLTPRHYESDRKVHRGRISKEGNTMVRWAAVEAIRRGGEPSVLEVRDRIVARRGKSARHIAKVAAAHRMLDVVYYTLRDGHARSLDTATAA
jgi:transposase